MLEDPSVTVIANLAAAETAPSAIRGASQITIPALLFSGSLDRVTPPSQHQIPIYRRLEMHDHRQPYRRQPLLVC